MVPLVWSGCSKDDQASIDASKLIGTWELTKDYDGEDDYWDEEWGEEYGFVLIKKFQADGIMKKIRQEYYGDFSTRDYLYSVESNRLILLDISDNYDRIVYRIEKLTSTELILAYDYRGDNGRTCTDKEYYKRID